MPHMLLVAVLVLTSACSLSPQRHCASALDEDFALLEDPPENRADLIALISDRSRYFRNPWIVKPEYEEAWFSDGEDSLILCQYKNVMDTCLNKAEWAVFTQAASEWSTNGPVMEICLREN